MIKELQPNCAIWSWGQDCQWVGNESGWAGETSWSTYGSSSVFEYGEENGWRWVPTEVDAKNGNGWFWNTSADALLAILLAIDT